MAEAKFFVLKLQGPDPEVKVKEYKRRRHHTKNRLGCLSCRQKRVKCDQGKPVCARCGRSGATCRYQASVPPSSSLSTPLQTLPAWSAVLVESILQPRFQHTTGPNTARKLPIQALLSHTTQGDVFGLPLTPTFWELACGHPHLLATVLAVSACHLRVLAADEPHGRPHRMAECALEAVALRDFQPALAAPLTQSRSDALLLTSMLLNNLAFTSVAEEGKGYPWVSLSPNNNDNNTGDGTTPSKSTSNGLGWLALGMGLRPLLATTKRFHGADSALTPIFQASDDENQAFSRSCEDVEGAPAHWTRLVSPEAAASTTSTDTDKDWCLRAPLGTLAAIRALPPTAENGIKYAMFVGALEAEFMELLCGRDERAMWMLGYWLGAMGRLGAWWADLRVRRDGVAIRRFLLAKGVCGRVGEEGEMWKRLMSDYDLVYGQVLS